MAIKILYVSNRVKKLLEDYPHLRDNDLQLISNIWYKDLKNKGFNPESLSTKDFLKLFSYGEFTNPESIRRSRQVLQKNFKHLQGNNYKDRHKHQEKIKEQLYETPELYPGGTP